jgi:ankyrin repeat protein
MQTLFSSLIPPLPPPQYPTKVEYMASTPGLVELNARNRNGATPFFAACNRGHSKIVKFLANKRLGDEFAVDIEVIERDSMFCVYSVEI